MSEFSSNASLSKPVQSMSAFQTGEKATLGPLETLADLKQSATNVVTMTTVEPVMHLAVHLKFVKLNNH